MPYPSSTLYPAESGLYPEAASPPTARVLRESAPDLAGLYLEEPDGTLTSVRPDNPALALVDYTFTSEREGGFATLDASIVSRDRDVAQKFQPASLIADAGDTLWEGRVDAPGEVSESGQVDLSAIGLAVLLAEYEFTFLGVSNDLTLWKDPPRARIENLGSLSQSVNQNFQVSAGEEGLAITMDADVKVEASSNGEAWWGKYGDLTVAEVQYMADDVQGTNMDPEIRSFETAGGSAIDNDNLVVTLAKTSFLPDPTQPYVVFRDTPSPALTAPGKSSRQVTIYAASVFGDHELPRAHITGLPDGLWFSDVLRFLAIRAGFAVSRDGIPTISRSSDPSPNLTWLESTILRDVLEEGLELEPHFAWQVWEGPTIWYGRRHRGARWDVRRSDGALFERSAETSDEDYNAVIVTYENRDGRTRRVGPPGSGCDTEDSLLLNSDPDLPLNRFGQVRSLVVDLGLASSDKALEIGQVALKEATREHWSGSVSLPRFALREGVWSPTFLLRADDVIFDGETGQELPVAAASYSRSDEHPATATIDTPANRLDAALAEFEAKPRKVNRKKIRRRYRRQRNARQRQAAHDNRS